MNNYSSTLFSQMVSTIETAINMNIDCGTYDQLADALNMQGFTNSRGQSFSGSTLQKYLHRIGIPKDIPEFILQSLKNFMISITPRD